MITKLSSRLKLLRNSKHLRQDEVAKRIGVNKSAISTYESGTRQPSYEVLIRLAKLYQVSIDYLLGYDENQTIDLSGLTDEEMNLVYRLITIFRRSHRERSTNNEN